jgi:hypothetical protein
LPSLLCLKQIHTLLISSESITGRPLQQALAACQSHGARVFRAKYFFESLRAGEAGMSRRAIGGGNDRGDEIRRLRRDLASLRKPAM